MNDMYQSHTALIERSIELSPETKSQIKIIDYQVNTFNSLEMPTEEDRRKLNQYIDDFIFHQKYLAVNNECSSPDELLDLWRKKQAYVTPKLSLHKQSGKAALTFEVSYLSFFDFYDANKQIFPSYTQLFSVFSTLCHNLYENICHSSDCKAPFNQYYFYTLMNKENPHKLYTIDDKWKSVISCDKLTSRNKLNAALLCLSRHHFPQHVYSHFSSEAFTYFLLRVSKGHSTKSLFVRYFVYVWLFSTKPTDSHSFFVYTESKKDPTRRPSWCVYYYKKRCSKLDIECHSSIDCPFYQGKDSSKLR